MHYFTRAAISSLLLTAACLLSPLVAAHDSDLDDALYARQAGGPILTTGAKGLGDGRMHTRIEINYMFHNHPNQWNLFILTMAKWMAMDPADQKSYFAISSIHGVPRETWNGVKNCGQGCSDADGYCPHASCLFPAWHRTYSALFEQIFIELAIEVANSFTGAAKQRMVTAAQSIRVPYWDWAARPDSGTLVPSFLTSESIDVIGPNGKQTIKNPLVSYHFPDPSKLRYGPFVNWPDTLRYPTSDQPDATSEESKVTSTFEGLRHTIRDMIYSIFANCDDYHYFAFDAAGHTDQCPNSLETIHNSIHAAGGGFFYNKGSSGHLGYLAISSFDSMFWVLHCGLDRIIALWQTLHPGQWGTDCVQKGHPTWTVALGSKQTTDSPLTPFRDTPNSFWTTRKVQDWRVFNYDYPEFKTSDGSRAAIVKYVNELYGPNPSLTASSLSRRLGKMSKKPKRDLDSHLAPQKCFPRDEQAPAYRVFNTTSSSVPTAPPSASSPSTSVPTTTGFPNATIGYNVTFANPNGHTYEYLCHFQSPRFALNNTYYIYVFDGEPAGQDPTSWGGDDHCLGWLGVLAGGGSHHGNTLTYGAIPMTRGLQKRVKEGKLISMDEKYTIPYLEKNLHWKIVGQGQVIPPESVPEFKASVYSGLSSPPGPDTLGSWHAIVPQVAVTKGKAGGACAVPPVVGMYPAPNGTVPSSHGSQPSGTGFTPPSFTGSASKPSFQVAGLLAAAGLVAVL